MNCEKLKPGDKVVRQFGGVKMTLVVAEVSDRIITWGGWEFDLVTGCEIDNDIGWGPPPLHTGSWLIEVLP